METIGVGKYRFKTLTFMCFCMICMPTCMLATKEDITGNGEKIFLTIAENGIAKAAIVCPPDAGLAARFAAEELKTYLDRVTGAEFQIREEMPPDGIRILIGDSKETRKLGIDINGLARDSYIIKRTGNIIIIAGRDDKTFDIRRFAEMKLGKEKKFASGWKCPGIPEVATVFGVYAFLEKNAGVRWYWPGEKGAYIPSLKTIAIANVNITDEPYFSYRWAYHYGTRGKHFSDYKEMGVTDRDINYWILQNRRSTLHVPVNHMPTGHDYFSRFGATHSEWFALDKNGNRNKAHFCYSSEEFIKEVIKDADAFFSGKAASGRGLKAWNSAIANENYFSLLPEDNMKEGCFCQSCMRNKNPEAPRYGTMSNIVWKYVSTVGYALEKKHPGKNFICLAYDAYRNLPEGIKLPGNIIPAPTALHTGDTTENLAMSRIFREIKNWHDFSGRKGFAWVYSCQECLEEKKLSGIPQTEIHAMGRFYRAAKNDILGSFWENDWGHAFQQHMDLYIYHRLTWNPDADVDEILREYCGNLYGPAQEKIYLFLTKVEELWVKKIIKSKPDRSWAAYLDITTTNSSDIWENIYTEKQMRQLNSWMNEASELVKGTEYEAKVEFFRKWYFAPLKASHSKYQELVNARNACPILYVHKTANPPHIDGHPDELWNNIPAIPLINASSRQTQEELEKTTVKLCWDSRNLYVLFSCSENKIGHLKADKYQLNSHEICNDDEVEIFLERKLDCAGYRHFIINAAGSVINRYVQNGIERLSKGEGLKIATWIDNEKKTWYVETAITFEMYIERPKTDDKWIANFCRTRQGNNKDTQISSWSPLIKDQFNYPERFGTIVFTDLPK